MTGRLSHKLSFGLKHYRITASVIILFCSVGTRLCFTLASDQAMLVKENADAATYLVPALSLLEQGSFLNRYNNPEITRTPGYPMFVAALMGVVGRDLRHVLILQTVLISFAVLIS